MMSEPDALVWRLVEFDVDRSAAVSVRAGLESGDALAVISGGFSIARTDGDF